MNTSFLRTLFGGLILAMGLLTSVATPVLAEAKTATFAVVDTQKIIQEAVAAKGVRKQLDGQRDAYQKEINSRQDKLQAMEKDLVKQRGQLSQEQFGQKRSEFERQVRDLEKTVQERKKLLDQAYAQSMEAVYQTLGQIIEEVARDQGANVVLFRQSVVWMADRAGDVTDEVLERLNTKLPQVTVSMPTTAAASTPAPAAAPAPAPAPAKKQ